MTTVLTGSKNAATATARAKSKPNSRRSPMTIEQVPISDHGRRALPQRRYCETFELRHGNQNTMFHVTHGYYADGTIGEIFISGAKAGSEVEAVARDGAVLLSIALQYGVPLEVIRHAITREANGKPSTIVGAVVDRIAKE